jgi:voltage-gated potassium channel
MDTPPLSRSERLKEHLHEIIFEADTPSGKFFDVALLVFILLSVIAVMLESVPSFNERFGKLLYQIEWGFTILFTLEYLLRLYVVVKPWRYATSFFGVIDLMSIIPTYLSFFVVGTQSLLVIRALRLLRIFRVLKLGHFLKEGQVIYDAVIASRNKILVFLFFIVVSVTIIGSVMYLVEGGANDRFTSIPRGIYWAIVTLTTVGYGDISPQTALGQFLSAIVMIMGYAVIAVPTGIVTSELNRQRQIKQSTQSCRFCLREGHDRDADFCKYCGNSLHRKKHPEEVE